MSACETTNAEFLEFVTNTNYTTEAETFGWSFIFVYFVSEKVFLLISAILLTIELYYYNRR